METRKIIGYKYPYETVDGFELIDSCIASNGELYLTHKYSFNDTKCIRIPKEIAESFEPIYEEVVFGGFEDIIKHFKGDLVSIGMEISIIPNDQLEKIIILSKQNYSFTPEFEEKLKQLGIEI